MAEACLLLVLIGVTAYTVFGGADLGAGLWDLTAGGAERGGRVRGLVQRSMSPVWEANHVWMPFVLVILWTAFPEFFGSIMSTLYVPLSGAALGIILRGTAFAVRGQAATLAEARTLGALFATSSVLVPFFLGAAVGGIASGRVPVGNAEGDAVDSWANPTSITIGGLAVLAGAYLAAVYLAADAARSDLPDLALAFRRRALGAGVVTGIVAIAALGVVHEDAPALYDGLTSGAGLACVIGSGVLGVAALGLIAFRAFGWARIVSAATVSCLVAGWALAQRPDLLPGKLTLDEAVASDATLSALLISMAVGAVILVPSLLLLYRLTLRGDLDQEFEPLDQRFKPMTAGDHPESR